MFRAPSRWRIDGTGAGVRIRPWSRSTQDGSPPEKTASLKLALSLTGASPTTRTFSAHHGHQDRSATNSRAGRELLFQYRLARFAVHAEQSESGVGPNGDEPRPLGAGRARHRAGGHRLLQQREQAFPRLRQEMQMGRQLQDKGIPYIASIWAIPSGRTPTRARRSAAAAAALRRRRWTRWSDPSATTSSTRRSNTGRSRTCSRLTKPISEWT